MTLGEMALGEMALGEMTISPQYRVLSALGTSFLSSPVLVRRERRFLLFWGAFSGRYFVLSMFECHVKFERIFDKIF